MQHLEIIVPKYKQMKKTNIYIYNIILDCYVLLEKNYYLKWLNWEKMQNSQNSVFFYKCVLGEINELVSFFYVSCIQMNSNTLVSEK